MLNTNFKKAKKHFFTFSCAFLLGTSISSINTMSEKSVVSTYQGVNGPWQLLEYLFISKVQNELELFQKHSFAALGLTGTAFLAKSFLFDQQNNQPVVENSKTSNQKNSLKNILTIVSTFAAGKTIFGFTTCVVKRNIQHKTLMSVLKQWDLYRQNFPTTLVDLFDELAETYTTQGETFFTTAIVSEIFQLLNHHIEHHFEGRYKKSEQKSINTMDALKGCTDIWKNFA